jgi:hypothetical protein
VTYLEAVEAGKAAAKSPEVFLRVVPDGELWVAVICHALEVEVRTDENGVEVYTNQKRLVRKEVVGIR